MPSPLGMISHMLQLDPGRERSFKTPLGSAMSVTLRLRGSGAYRLVLCLSLPLSNTVFHECFRQQAFKLLWDMCVWSEEGPLSSRPAFVCAHHSLWSMLLWVTLGTLAIYSKVSIFHLHLQLAGPQPAFSLEHALPALAEDLTHLDGHTHLWGG